MLKKVREYVEFHHMIERGDRIVIGLSGGADSVALFLLLNELKDEYKLKLFAAHINHGIRAEAECDAAYARTLCEQFQVPFYLFEADIPSMAKMQGKSEEEMGRDYRYQCFYEILEKEQANKIAVAHHMDDRAETVLFHLSRGTDLSGMSGIRPINGKIIRPLLNCRKEELVAFLTEQNVEWKEDVTNQDNDYSRNKIRNQVLPQLLEVNEQAVKHITEFADHAAEYEAFFQKVVAKYMDENVVHEKECAKTEIEKLLTQDRILATAVIYKMMVGVCGAKKDIVREHILSVYDLLGKQTGKRVDLPYRMEAEISYGKLIIRKCLQNKPLFWKKEIALEDIKNGMVIDLPFGGRLTLEIRESMPDLCRNHYTNAFDCATIEDTLCLRTAETTDYLVINENGSRKKLSRHFIDEKVPAEERKKKLVAAIGHEVLWVIGGRRCENYKINENTKSVLILTYGGESE